MRANHWTPRRTRSGPISARRLVIAHVIPTLRTGGLEGVVVRLTDCLRTEFEHAVITPSGDGPLRHRFPAGVRVIAMAEQHRPDWANALRMARLFRALRPDIVHSRNWSCVDAIVGARLAQVPVVIHGEHGRDASDPKGRNRPRRWTRRLLAPLVAQFVTVSQDLAGWLVKDVGVPARKVVVIPNGVDAGRFVVDRVAARRALDLPADGVTIGTVGRLDPVKDQAGLVQAFAQLGSHPKHVLVIAGDGPSRSAIEGVIRDLELAGRVRLLGERTDVPQVLGAFDIFAQSSLAEGMSNTILEAMAAGLPVVATDVGGNAELVLDGITGRLVRDRTPRALAAALKSYSDDRVLAARHGGAGRDRVRAEFTLEGMAQAYADLYRTCAHGRVAP